MFMFCYNCKQNCLYNEQLDKLSIQLDILIDNIEYTQLKPPVEQEIIAPPSSPTKGIVSPPPLPPPLPILTSPTTTDDNIHNGLLSSIQAELSKRTSI